MAGSTARILAGGNKVAFVTVDDGTTPSIGATWAYVLEGNILSTSVSKQDSGQFDVSIEHVEDNAALQSFLNASIVTTTGGIEELLFEDGTRELASTSSNTKYITIIRGGLAGGVTGGARKAGARPRVPAFLAPSVTGALWSPGPWPAPPLRAPLRCWRRPWRPRLQQCVVLCCVVLCCVVLCCGMGGECRV